MALLRAVALSVFAALAAGSPASAAGWHELDPGNRRSPVARSAHLVVLDAPGRRLVAWGDRIGPGEIWTMSLDGPAVWTRIATAGTPPPRRVLASAIFDPLRRRMVIFGGGVHETTIAYRNDVWALSLDGVPTWTQLVPTGTLPDPRQMHAAIYDAPRDRMVVFGGISSSSPPYVAYENSVWAMSLGADPEWTLLAPTGTPPAGRLSASMVYDTAGDRALVFGGYNSSLPSPYFSDVWSLSLAGTPAWIKLAPAGTAPSPRYEHVAVMDDARRRMLVFAGRGLNIISTNDTWALSLAAGTPAWSQLGPATITPRFSPAGIIDPVTDRLIVDGGALGSGRLNETLAMPLAGAPAWQVLSPAGPPSAPPPRVLPTLLVDPATDRLLVQDGYDYTTTPGFPNDVWGWPLGDAAQSWERLAADIPINNQGSAIVLDPVRRRQVRLFVENGRVEVMPLDSPGTWTPLAVQGTPPPRRYGYSVLYEPTRDRILLTGGYVDASRGHTRTYFTDIWALTLADPPAWQQVRPDGAGLRVIEGAMIYDAPGDRLVGVGWDTPGNGTWAWPADGSSDWSLLSWSPPGLAYPAAVFDAATRDMIVLDLGPMIAWRVPLAGASDWSTIDVGLNAPPGRRHTRVAFDPVRRRMLVFGGQRIDDFNGILDDLWALELDPLPPPPPPPPPAHLSFAIAGARPNPSAGSPAIVFSLENADPARLDLFDLAGRRVESHEVGALGPGEHTLRIGARLAPGVYLARLARHDRAVTARIAVTR